MQPQASRCHHSASAACTPTLPEVILPGFCFMLVDLVAMLLQADPLGRWPCPLTAAPPFQMALAILLCNLSGQNRCWHRKAVTQRGGGENLLAGGCESRHRWEAPSARANADMS